MRSADAVDTVSTTGKETTVTKDTAGGIVTGAVGGGVLGGLAGLLVGIGAIAIPGLGALVVAGPVATTLIGAGVGAAAGGLVGALVEAGVPEEEARVYETGVKQGGVLVTARVPAGMEQMALDIMNAKGARDIRNDERIVNTNVNYANADYNRTGTERRHEVEGEAAGGVAGNGVADAADDTGDEDAAHDANIYHTDTDTTYRTDTEA
jgi:hypothetical protein